jgi:hypothetical protein
VVGGGAADSMLQICLERRGDRMKRRHRTHLESMGRKREKAQRRDNVSSMRGGTRKGKRRRQH